MALDTSYFINPSPISTSTAIVGKNASELDMNDFFNLLTAQLTNQDMMNPVNDTEFIAQMAQFSSLQGIQTLSEYTLAAYATSYAGKYVTVAHQTETGTLDTIKGYVSGVSFYDGKPKVTVDGKNYDLFEVMEVSGSADGGSVSEASSYIGKTVTVEYKNEYEESKTVEGKVTSVTVKDFDSSSFNFDYRGKKDVTCVVIDGVAYPASQIVKTVDNNAGSLNDASYYIGKTVCVELVNDFGEKKSYEGTVTSATIRDGVAYVDIDGVGFPVSSIVSILSDFDAASASGTAPRSSATLPSASARAEVNDMDNPEAYWT